MAFRPKTLTAGIVPVLVATALVKAEGFSVHIWITACALLSSMCIQIGTNFINDAIDFKKGADDERRIGPQRVTQSGRMTSNQVMIGGGVFFFLAFVLGIPLVIEGGWPIVVIGVCSLFCGYCYTGGPFPLAYVGLGDAFVIIFYGFVAVIGTFFLQTKTVTSGAWIAGAQIGLLATVLIAINNTRDAPLDRLVNKRTLAVRLGLKGARIEIALAALIPFALGVFWFATAKPFAGLIPVLSLPIAVILLKSVRTTEPSPAYNRFLGQAAGLHLLFGLLLTLGLCFS